MYPNYFTPIIKKIDHTTDRTDGRVDHRRYEQTRGWAEMGWVQNGTLFVPNKIDFGGVCFSAGVADIPNAKAFSNTFIKWGGNPQGR